MDKNKKIKISFMSDPKNFLKSNGSFETSKNLLFPKTRNQHFKHLNSGNESRTFENGCRKEILPFSMRGTLIQPPFRKRCGPISPNGWRIRNARGLKNPCRFRRIPPTNPCP